MENNTWARVNIYIYIYIYIYYIYEISLRVFYSIANE